MKKVVNPVFFFFVVVECSHLRGSVICLNSSSFLIYFLYFISSHNQTKKIVDTLLLLAIHEPNMYSLNNLPANRFQTPQKKRDRVELHPSPSKLQPFISMYPMKTPLSPIELPKRLRSSLNSEEFRLDSFWLGTTSKDEEDLTALARNPYSRQLLNQGMEHILRRATNTSHNIPNGLGVPPVSDNSEQSEDDHTSEVSSMGDFESELSDVEEIQGDTDIDDDNNSSMIDYLLADLSFGPGYVHRGPVKEFGTYHLLLPLSHLLEIPVEVRVVIRFPLTVASFNANHVHEDTFFTKLIVCNQEKWFQKAKRNDDWWFCKTFRPNLAFHLRGEPVEQSVRRFVRHMMMDVLDYIDIIKNEYVPEYITHRFVPKNSKFTNLSSFALKFGGESLSSSVKPCEFCPSFCRTLFYDEEAEPKTYYICHKCIDLKVETKDISQSAGQCFYVLPLDDSCIEKFEEEGEDYEWIDEDA